MTATNIAEELDRFRVDIDSLNPYPGNARRGNVRAIAESLGINGQYKPIVVNVRTMQVLAGNHTLEAARSLGWDQIAATFVDVDEEQARKIVLADNRLADVGSYDPAGVVALLESLGGDLDGTGYDAAELERLRHAVDTAGLFAEDRAETAGWTHQTAEDDLARIQAGSHSVLVTTNDFRPWVEALVGGLQAEDGGAVTQIQIEAELRRRLGLEGTEPPPKAARAAKTRPKVEMSGERYTAVECDLVAMADVKPHPANPRRSDVAGIAESLAVNGQYRPIVVNRRTMEILAGNHTAEAARLLEWPEIAATFVDVDDDTAKRIVLVDNRAGDLAYYDQDALGGLLRGLQGDYVGTGYDEKAMGDLLKGVAEWDLDERRQETGNGPDIRVLIKHNGMAVRWEVVIERAAFFAWNERLVRSAGYSDAGIRAELLARLGLAVTEEL